MNLAGKTALLTGATGGIGRAFALALADCGVKLILVSRNLQKLNDLQQCVSGEGHRHVVADLSESAGRKTVVDACPEGVDIVVNNAGINNFGLLQQLTEYQLRQMFELNTLAPILLVQALLPQLMLRDSIVVNVGSGFGSIGFPGYCGYSASKFGLRGFSEALRRELADSSVSVRYLGPRATDTAMNSSAVVAMNTELGNAVDSPEAVASELLKLLSKPAGIRCLGWPEKFFIKLNAVFPGLVDKALRKQLPVIQRYALAAGTEAG